MNNFTQNKFGVSFGCAVVAICLLALGILNMSQPVAANSQVPATLARPQDPVIMPASGLPAALSGLANSSLAVFAYDEGAQSWTQIPYQVDDITSTGQYTTTTGDDDGAGVIDTTDEFVFMAADAGDQIASADVCNAIALPCTVASAPTFDYHEIAVSDPTTGDMGWVYVVDTTQGDISCSASSADYVSWNAGTQTAVGSYNAESFTATFGGTQATPFVGIADLATNGGADLLDRQKLRLDACANFLGCIPVTADEEEFADLIGTALLDVPIDGAVRLAAGTDNTTFVYGSLLDVKIEVDPGSFDSPFPITVNSLRSSFDFNSPASTGVTNWCDSNGNAYTIDGTNDPAPGVFDWYQGYGGASGGLHVSNPSIVAGSGVINAYYLDSAPSGTLPDGTTDTGDGNSYSDTGVNITNSGGTVIGFSLSAYVLPTGTNNCSTGARYDAWANTPLSASASATYSVNSTSCVPTAVEMSDVGSSSTSAPLGMILVLLGTIMLSTSLVVRRK